MLGSIIGGIIGTVSAGRAADSMRASAETARKWRLGMSDKALDFGRGRLEAAGRAQVQGARNASRALVHGARTAGRAGVNAANQRLDLAGDVLAGQREQLDPYATAGRNALGAYNYEMGLGDRPADYRGFEATPGYEFRLNQGLDAITGRAAATGSSLSGAAAQALMGYGQNLASEEYGGYMDRLSGLTDQGLQASGALGNALAQYGQVAGGALADRGAARAGQANAIAAARAGRAGTIADARANMNTNIGNLGVNTFMYQGEAAAKGSEDIGNINAARHQAVGNALNGMVEGVTGSLAAMPGGGGMGGGFGGMPSTGGWGGGSYGGWGGGYPMAGQGYGYPMPSQQPPMWGGAGTAGGWNIWG